MIFDPRTNVLRFTRLNVNEMNTTRSCCSCFPIMSPLPVSYITEVDMSSQLPPSKLLFISFTFFRSSTLVRTVTWIEPLCFRLGRDLAGFSGPAR